MSSKVEKLQKQAIKEQQRRIKPGECQKYVRLVLDSNFMQFSLGQELVQQLNQKDLKYVLRCLPVSNCIIWERNVGQHTLLPGTSANAIDDAWQMEKQVLHLLTETDFKRLMKEETLACMGAKLSAAYVDCQYTIVVPRMRQSKQAASSSDADALIEMQLLQNLHIVEMKPQCAELLALLQRYTKAIAEMHYKQQRSETLDSFKKYLANDKKQCVRVEQGNGYGRLWQQHLNRLPMVTLEVAESIIAQHPCPKRLLDDFANNPCAVQTLADMKIKRTNGPQPLQTERRIGNVLANKLYTLYNARDPNTLI